MGEMEPIVILKVGGSLGTQAMASLTAVIHKVTESGRVPIVVHGGGPRISAALSEEHIDLPFIDGQRLTPPAAMPIVERVLCDEVNGELTSALCGTGIPAVSFVRTSHVLFASPLPGMGRTAIVTGVDALPLLAAVRSGEVPVVAPVATEQKTDLACNVNADLAASAIARAVSAERIVFFTDVDGIYSNFQTGERITYTTSTELLQGLSAGKFEGGMRPKVTAVLEALASSVEAAFVIHGGRPNAALWAVSEPVTTHFPSSEEEAEKRTQAAGLAPGTCVRAHKVANAV
jgi:acetylglutamate kinase